MLASLLSKPQPSLSAQAKHLVAMRFLIYTGFQTSYFIGVIGTLTYADDASVVATSLAVLFMNVFVILGSFAGGAALDALGPRRHFLLSIVGTLATGAAILVFGSATGIVLLGAVLLGFVMGFAQPIATSYPAYLTDDPVELKDINSAIAMFSNVSIIVGPTLGGFVAAAASSRAVFVLMMLFTALALIVGWGFRPRTGLATAHEGKPAIGDTTSDNTGQCPDPNTSSRATFATSIKTVFTIHNIAYQGKFSFEFVQDLLGIDARYYTPEFMELNGCANLLKAGCVFADHINTVSPSYAGEIRTVAYGEGLEGILNARQHQLSGILNGIDTAVFDPAHDGGIAAPYSADDLSGKAACRAALCRELGLEIGAHTPIVAMVTRMTPQKGFDLVQCVLDELKIGRAHV